MIIFPTNRKGKVPTKLFVDLMHGYIYASKDSVEGMKLGDIIAWLFKLRLNFYDTEEAGN